MKIRTLNKLIKRVKANGRKADLQKDLLKAGYRVAWVSRYYGWIMQRTNRPGALTLADDLRRIGIFDGFRKQRLDKLTEEKKSKRKPRQPSKINRYGQRGI